MQGRLSIWHGKIVDYFRRTTARAEEIRTVYVRTYVRSPTAFIYNTFNREEERASRRRVAAAAPLQISETLRRGCHRVTKFVVVRRNINASNRKAIYVAYFNAPSALSSFPFTMSPL